MTNQNNGQNNGPKAGFGQFNLHENLQRGIDAAGFTEPRTIQVDTIPAIMRGVDVLGLAQTGTGKTAAFALPILDGLLRNRRKASRVLILAPTRELATQIAEEIRLLSRFARIKVAVVYGGVPIYKQTGVLRSLPEIIVGCPGRVLDQIERGALRTDQIETLVLDEADQMFDMGFLPGIKRILRELPRERQNLLFSATMPSAIRSLAHDILRNPHVVELASQAPVATIDHALIMVGERQKRELLEHLLGQDDCHSAIVFTRTKHRAKRLAMQLENAGHRAVGLQGNLSQAQRDRAMKGFRSRRFNVLVATDIVARGIDVSGISHVINYDVPNTPEAYTHRIGRTGRAEMEGTACTFVTGADHGWLRATERMIGDPIQRRKIEGFQADTEAAPAYHSARQGRPRGGRNFNGQRGRRRRTG
ncbi:ATP-dependent helicase [bacterium]|nr:MAG: ATP-dependent helicase [bacterium]